MTTQPSPAAGDPRTEEIASGLRRVTRRLASACLAAGRSPAAVTLIAVTKTYPACDVARLAALGVTEVGENRDQEAAPKAAELAAAGVAVSWHFIGRLQRNKCRSVARYAAAVHSVDSVRLARVLATAGRDREHPLNVLAQVSLDGDPGRGGAVTSAAEPEVCLDRVLATLAGAAELRLRGVMAVAPLSWDAEAAFERLAAIAERVRVEYPEATWISAGMSEDLETAVRYGSTHVRVGSALLGKRAALR